MSKERHASFCDRLPRTLRVRGRDDKVYTVDPRGKCSCGRRRFCEHFRLAAALLCDPQSLRQEVNSALHKEIRRGDLPHALMWLHWARQIRPDSGIDSYYAGILLEETRNFALFHRWREERPTLDERIRDLCLSTKRWELPVASCVARDVNTALMDAVLAPKITLSELHRADSFLDWARQNMRMHLVRECCKRNRWDRLVDPNPLLDSLVARMGSLVEQELVNAGRHDVWQAVHAIAKGQEAPWSPYLAGLEVALGLWSEDANTIREQSAPDTLPYDAMVFPDYVFDSHVREGRKRMKLLDEHPPAPNAQLPLSVDPRWSGTPLGIWWRYTAHAALGEAYKDTPWHSTPLDERQTTVAHAADRFWRRTSPLFARWRPPR